MRDNRSVLDLARFDESPHFGSPIEWWYVHGWLDGPDFKDRPFMVSFFRHNISGSENAYSLLMNIQGMKPGEQHYKSWITGSLVSQTIRRAKTIKKLNLDGMFSRTFLQEFEQCGIPREISLLKEKPLLRPSPLSIEWKDFSLRQDPSGFMLSFLDPAGGRGLTLRLRPLKSPVDLKDVFFPNSEPRKMSYNSYTRMAAEGEWGRQAVSGTAWLDHQWGKHSWFLQGETEKRTLCWDFFGFHLDDRTEISMVTNRDSATGDVLDQAIMKHDGKGRVDSVYRFSARPVRYWESPASAARHPVGWEFHVPDWDLRFTFLPGENNQELPVFGLQRVIWQGAGLAEGTWRGRPFRSKARGELQGYGYIHDYRKYLQTLADRIDRHIADFLPKHSDEARLKSLLGAPTWIYEPAAYQEMLSSPVWELISRKGKRWRPVFAILLIDALGTSPQPYEALVSNLAELAHTGSLIIDDIQDASVLRRGKASIHTMYGLEVAISAANTLYFLCTRLLFGHPHLTRDQQLDIHEVVMGQFTRAHFGQALDLFWSRNLTPKNLDQWMKNSLEGKILQMYELKTAAPIQGLAAAASIIHGTRPETKAACIRFASDLGIAFQIIDDIHNFSRSPKWRKEPAEDIAEGKVTFVIVEALTALDGCRSSRLKEILTSPELRRRPELRNEAADLVRNSGVLSACRERAQSMLETAWEILSPHLEASQAKILLRTLTQKLIQAELQESAQKARS
jgi:geranylgeranyl pyrophosphate synthase/predicted secreted hydrolase